MAQQHDEQLWGWLKEWDPGREFDSQVITGSREDYVEDACWRLVSAGILRPTAGNHQYKLTAIGAEILQGAESPYSTSNFFQSVTEKSSRLDEDSKGYFRIALDGLTASPHGAVALFRAALDAEIGSLIEEFEASSKGGGRVNQLHKRDLGERIAELVKRTRGRGVDAVLMDEFEAACTQIRISANRVLHPDQGVPVVDATEICGVSHSFRRMSELSTIIKEEFEKRA